MDDTAQSERERIEAVIAPPKEAHDAYENIWNTFADDWSQGRGLAYKNLLMNLTRHAADLVPSYMTAKDHMAMVTEAAKEAGEGHQGKEDDPISITSSWLRGDIELSRIPLEEKKRRKHIA